ncbi:unnamed protein product [Amoebophrya sp. A25]|nr:unnamed protein product [Amoebophrya sp. A25]|eukprot:GSA25T00002787001.1
MGGRMTRKVTTNLKKSQTIEAILATSVGPSFSLRIAEQQVRNLYSIEVHPIFFDRGISSLHIVNILSPRGYTFYLLPHTTLSSSCVFRCNSWVLN